jgi:hypothetical protein
VSDLLTRLNIPRLIYLTNAGRMHWHAWLHVRRMYATARLYCGAAHILGRYTAPQSCAAHAHVRARCALSPVCNLRSPLQSGGCPCAGRECCCRHRLNTCSWPVQQLALAHIQGSELQNSVRKVCPRYAHMLAPAPVSFHRISKSAYSVPLFHIIAHAWCAATNTLGCVFQPVIQLVNEAIVLHACWPPEIVDTDKVGGKKFVAEPNIGFSGAQCALQARRKALSLSGLLQLIQDSTSATCAAKRLMLRTGVYRPHHVHVCACQLCIHIHVCTEQE